ncbi:hypothetical protein [Nitrosomonas communis]|uniref:hypothetical protein n=1 Tax=Nitrosomonas communis TaxID=44574 RepID=UPI0026EDA6FE|nr:hypothetical protein [Nitrosomonas communis]MCO6427541.1 hypothetical protein [Nitrosomonas communis]
MRAFVLLAVLFVQSAQSHANDLQSWCESISKLGAAIMSSRQSGVAMSEIMKQKFFESQKLNNLIEAMTINAFEEPRYHSEEMQKRSVEDFRNSVYLECTKANRQ